MNRLPARTVPAALVFAAIICLGTSAAFPQGSGICFTVDSLAPWAANAPAPMDIGLYYGGDTVANQAAHPDIEYWPDGFGPVGGATVIGVNRDGYPDTLIAAADTPRWKYWMVFTPYVYSQAVYEDPTIRVSNARESGWIRPYAVGDDPTDSSENSDTVWVNDPIYNHYHYLENGHCSDPEFAYVPEEGRLYVLFRTSSKYTHKIYLKATFSTDGISWDETQAFNLVVSGSPEPWKAWGLVSPSVCRDAPNRWRMWFVDIPGLNQGSQIIELTAPRLDTTWTAVDTCLIAPPDTTLQIWHIKVVRSPMDSALYLLATINSTGSTSAERFGQYLYVSQSGEAWNMVGEILPNGPPGAWDNETYRSTFRFERVDGRWTMPIWYTGAREIGPGLSVWGIGFTTAYPQWVQGDINGDCRVNISDITFLINYLYKGGLRPDAKFLADIDGNCRANIQDITYLICNLYKGGPAPRAGCEQ